MPGLKQHFRGPLEFGMVHQLDHPVEVLAVPLHDLRQGAVQIRGDFQVGQFRFRAPGPGIARLPQGIPEIAVAPVAQALGEAHDGAHADPGPLGRGLDPPQGAEQRVSHQGIGDGSLRLRQAVIGLGDADLDVRDGGC